MYPFRKAGGASVGLEAKAVRWVPWNDLVKRVVARFARGNIAAQEGRILLPEEQAAERDRAHAIARAWWHRAQNTRI
jgi:hypothetical protein